MSKRKILDDAVLEHKKEMEELFKEISKVIETKEQNVKLRHKNNLKCLNNLVLPNDFESETTNEITNCSKRLIEETAELTTIHSFKRHFITSPAGLKSRFGGKEK